MLQLFRSNNPLTAVPLAIYVVLLNLFGFLFPSSWEPAIGGLLSDPILDLIGDNHFLSVSLAVVLIFVQALMLNSFSYRFKISRISNYFPALFYVFSLTFLRDTYTLTPLLMALTFYIIALFELFDVYKKKEVSGNAFNIGFWLAVGSFFYFSVLIFALLGILGLMSLRGLKIREVLILIIGLVTPYFLVGTYFFWTDGLSLFISAYMLDQLGFFNLAEVLDWRIYVRSIFSGLILLGALVNLQKLLFKTKIQTQKNIGLLFSSVLVALLSLLFQSNLQMEHLIIICVPISLFLCLHFITFRNKPVAEFLHFILLAFFLVFQYWDVLVEFMQQRS